MEEYAVLNYPVHVGSRDSLMDALTHLLAQGRSPHVVTLNPEMVMRGEHDPGFARLLRDADLILPDGAGVVWALKRQGVNVERIPGIEFSEALIAQAAQQGDPIALVGAAPEVNEAAQAQLLQRYPGLQISYAHHGFFLSPEDRRQVAQACAQSAPKHVFVALGVPGQEQWIAEFSPLFTSPTVFVGVGGSFDIWSGLKKRAHPLFLKLNLEWLYRITSEPFRLKRVYKTLPAFMVKVWLHHNQSVRTHADHHGKPHSPSRR